MFDQYIHLVYIYDRKNIIKNEKYNFDEKINTKSVAQFHQSKI